MKDAFVAIHGHFYQPPRENPWLEAIEAEESARPFHDWNERITSECYQPNAYARVVDSRGKILDIVNNYSFISFNFGPTLFRWLEKRFPAAYERILEADQESLGRFGHGNAVAQVYNHIIMPLANEKDKETEVLWGIADFERRFQRRPDAMWLPETAVDNSTLEILVKHGMRFLILSPFQALRARPFGSKKWTDASSGRIDPTRPYRCFVKDQHGKKALDRFIDLFFYDGGISKEIAFQDLLRDGNAFCERFSQAFEASRKRPQLVHIATDGETYGHHKKFGEMALAYAVDRGFRSRGMELINYGAFLKRFPPVYEVEIDEGPKGEGSSWSCSHRVGRWKEDCGCSAGAEAGWNQKWRKPLREALDLLRDELSLIFEKEGEKIFKDPWKARNGYIEVILDRTPEVVRRFFDQYGRSEIDDESRTKGLKLLEMERHGLQMYTSCGWFFADLAGLETRIVLQNAARAIQLADELIGQEIETKFLDRLSEGKSNLPEMGDGREIYLRLVKPKSVALEDVVNHFAVSSLFDGGEGKRIFVYRVEKVNYERAERNGRLLVLGQVRVDSEIIPEPKEFLFGLASSKKGIFRTRVSGLRDGLDFDILRAESLKSLGIGEEETERVLDTLLGGRTLTIRDTFKEERQAIFQKLIEEELNEHRRIYAELFDKTREVVEALAGEGLEVPYEIRVAAEVTLSNRLLREIKRLEKDDKVGAGREEIDRIIEEARQHGYRLQTEEPVLILNRMLNEKMEDLKQTLGRRLSDERKAEKVDEVLGLLGLEESWGFELRKEEAQNLMDGMLDEYVLELERSWWGNGSEKSFPPSLLTLAEKLGFNIDRFSKMMPSST